MQPLDCRLCMTSYRWHSVDARINLIKTAFEHSIIVSNESYTEYWHPVLRLNVLSYAFSCCVTTQFLITWVIIRLRLNDCQNVLLQCVVLPISFTGVVGCILPSGFEAICWASSASAETSPSAAVPFRWLCPSTNWVHHLRSACAAQSLHHAHLPHAPHLRNLQDLSDWLQ
jgi:hypothetical protein